MYDDSFYFKFGRVEFFIRDEDIDIFFGVLK